MNPAQPGIPPTDSEAVGAAEQMNDPDGPHPSVEDREVGPADGDDPVPDLMG